MHHEVLCTAVDARRSIGRGSGTGHGSHFPDQGSVARFAHPRGRAVCHHPRGQERETAAGGENVSVGHEGEFHEKVPGTGNFVLTITSVGRNPIVRDFTVKAGEKLVDFGTLYITDASNELGQVEVVAQKPLVKADIDKIEYNVKDDPDSETNSLLEMLRKVPLVTVDGRQHQSERKQLLQGLCERQAQQHDEQQPHRGAEEYARQHHQAH